MLLTFINWAVSGEFAESTQHFLKCLITCVFLCLVCTPRSRTHFVSSPNLSPLQIFENLRMHLLLPACVCAHGGMFWSWTGDPVHAKQVFNQWAVFSTLPLSRRQDLTEWPKLDLNFLCSTGRLGTSHSPASALLLQCLAEPSVAKVWYSFSPFYFLPVLVSGNG